jgi:hypothetical protein
MLHSPDVQGARRVADLAAMDDVSLAERFVLAAATLVSPRGS